MLLAKPFASPIASNANASFAINSNRYNIAKVAALHDGQSKTTNTLRLLG